MKKKILFIINPISGDIKKANIPDAIEKYLDHRQYESRIVYTERAGHAKHLAAEAVATKVDVIVAVGGDGSINEVAQALIHTNTVLGIIPLGSGNGLASHLQLPIRHVKKAIEVINKGKVVPIDTGESNLGAFISCAGEGIDAAVARIYRHHSMRGFFSYFIAVVKAVFGVYQPMALTIQAGGQTFHTTTLLCSIFNARFYGYRVSIYPKASIVDGLLDLVLIEKVKWWRLPYVVFMGLIGKVDTCRETSIVSTNHILVTKNQKRTVQLDGDSMMTSSNFELKVNPLSLKVIVPQGVKKL